MLKNKLKSTVSVFVLLSYVSILSPGYALEDDSSSDDEGYSSSSSPQKRSRAEMTPSPRSPSSTPSCSSSSLPTSSDTAASSEDSAKRQRVSPMVGSSSVEDDPQSDEPLLLPPVLSGEGDFIQAQAHFDANNFEQAFQSFLSADKKGCSQAAFFIADMYIRGQGTQKNITRGFEVFKGAAGKEQRSRCECSGEQLVRDCLQAGCSVAKTRMDHYEKAVVQYENDSTLMASKDYPKILMEIGRVFDRSLEDEERAKSYYQRAADLGYWRAILELEREEECCEYTKSFNLAKSLETINLAKAIKIYKKLSDYDVVSALRLGELYEKGHPPVIEQDFIKALELYREAWDESGKTYEEAGLKYAEMYEKGLGEERDLDEAFYVYDKLESDNPEAAYRAGWLLDFNPRFSSDPKPYYKTAVRGGNLDAQFMMGLIKRDGRDGSNQDVTRALRWFQKAANQGHLASSILLVEMLLKTQSNPRSEAQAFNKFKGIYQNARFKETWRRFFRFSESQNEEQAFQLLKARISTGDIENILAIAYRLVGKYRQDLSLVRLAMEKGSLPATLTLAGIYERGWRSIDSNPEEALDLYISAGRRGSRDAMYKVAEAYKNGKGSPRFFSAAFNWFRDAALAGHQEARCKQQQLFHFLIPEALRGAYEGDYFDPREHDIPVLVSLYDHPDHKQAIMAHWKTLLESPDREVMRDISLFILENYKALEISEESDFFIEVAGKWVLSEDSTDPKNPFIVWPALLQKRAVPVDVRSLVPEAPLWEAEGQHWRFNPARLEAFGTEVHINQETVPLITPDDFIADFEKIQAKLRQNPGLIQPALDQITKVHNDNAPLPFGELETYALSENRKSFFIRTLSKDSVTAAQLKCVLRYIRSFSDQGEDALSLREERLIDFLMAVKACEIGQESGLTSYYQTYVPSSLKYEVTGDLFNQDFLDIQKSKYMCVSLIKEVVDSILNTDNSFMQRVCGVTGKVPQLSHQALYLKTLIGDKISAPFSRFDPSTNCLVDPLLTLSKADALKHFYGYLLKDENLLKEVQNKINQAVLTGNVYVHLSDLTQKWTYANDDEGTPSITREGVMELLIGIGLFSDGSTGSSSSSSS
jgi:TPR repeat protein